jgi:HD superfamily phosphohydrolase YqeK
MVTLTHQPVAHLRSALDGSRLEHDLAAHLIGVAELAAVFASEFGKADWTMVAGMRHDLGKLEIG